MENSHSEAMQGPCGYLFGVAAYGGAAGNGTVFALATSRHVEN